MKVLMLCHNTPIDGGTIHEILKKRDDVQLDYRFAYHEPLKDIDPEEHDVTIFMGGSMGVYNRDIFPYLNQEITYLKARLAAGKPYLGICLGSQLMAHALGGDVTIGTQGKEVGWSKIKISEAGQNTPLKYFDQSVVNVMQFHGDTFTVPEQAMCLGSSDLYPNQIIAHGDKAIGLQFHPEVNSNILEMWMVMGFDSLIKAGIDPLEFRASFEKELPVLKKQTEKFFNEWLEIVTQ